MERWSDHISPWFCRGEPSLIRLSPQQYLQGTAAISEEKKRLKRLPAPGSQAPGFINRTWRKITLTGLFFQMKSGIQILQCETQHVQTSIFANLVTSVEKIP